MKKIIVTTDLSEESTRAFALARKIAESLEASVVLLAVVEDPSQAAFAYAMEFPAYPDPAVHKQVLEKVSADLQQLTQTHFSGLKCETFVSEALGSVAVEICEYAGESHADMIVISSHGRSGISRLLIGSVAERVIREAPCPVLVVPVRKA